MFEYLLWSELGLLRNSDFVIMINEWHRFSARHNAMCLCGDEWCGIAQHYSIHVDTAFIQETLIETFYERIITFPMHN